MGGVVAGVPGVEGGSFGDGLAAVFGMDEAALPLVFREGAQQEHPAVVQGVEETERELGGRGEGVGEFGPELFVVGLDGGPVLGEGEADADDRVHVAVGDVVDELADGPATVAVRCVELSGAEAVDGGTEGFRQGGEGGDVGRVVGGVGFGAAESADGVARVNLSYGGGRGHTPQGIPRGVAQQGGCWTTCPG